MTFTDFIATLRKANFQCKADNNFHLFAYKVVDLSSLYRDKDAKTQYSVSVAALEGRFECDVVHFFETDEPPIHIKATALTELSNRMSKYNII